MEDSDPNRLRDVEISRLAQMAELAFRNVMDEALKMRTREGWYQKYTNAVLALNQLLKDSQYKDYEKRLKVLEESGKTLRRMVWPRALTKKRVRPSSRKPENNQYPRISSRRSV